ncbi:haloacid dehalogenase-like hydrolase [Aestuariivivens marinum]|uniref:haloacid dehalogenase-like hydrolase n=1 Tax=Aestuariivivens marinum TaxID=2913555 RepID=UPI001F592A8B|nr:haloacid dehalogenase-like hydrolase [Aestuariivivens marinum]
MKIRVLVVDLDGTLYATNTFRQFIKYVWIRSIMNVDIILSFQVLFLIIMRLIRIIGHAELKFYFLSFIANRSYIDKSDFVSSLCIYKRNIMVLQSQKYNLKVLATAAPEIYSRIIAKEQGFDVCIATKNPNSRYHKEYENSKENKKENVLSYLKTKGLDSVDLLITDHVDDLPLIKISKRNIIVNPNIRFEKMLQALEIDYKVANYG